MKLRNQKRTASKIIKSSPKRISFDKDRLDEIKESITRVEIKRLIKEKAITSKPKKGISRVRARKRLLQKRKGRRKGEGKKKGRSTARLSRKEMWINKIRVQRRFLESLKSKNLIDTRTYRDLYRKSKGNLFRSRRHIQLYLEENKLIKKDGKR